MKTSNYQMEPKVMWIRKTWKYTTTLSNLISFATSSRGYMNFFALIGESIMWWQGMLKLLLEIKLKIQCFRTVVVKKLHYLFSSVFILGLSFFNDNPSRSAVFGLFRCWQNGSLEHIPGFLFWSTYFTKWIHERLKNVVMKLWKFKDRLCLLVWYLCYSVVLPILQDLAVCISEILLLLCVWFSSKLWPPTTLSFSFLFLLYPHGACIPHLVCRLHTKEQRAWLLNYGKHSRSQ